MQQASSSRKRNRLDLDKEQESAISNSSEDYQAIESLLASAASHSDATQRPIRDSKNTASHRSQGNHSHRSHSSNPYDDASNLNHKSSEDKADDQEQKEKIKPSFGLSGALAKDEKTGNVYNGVVLKFVEPPEARAPNTRWRLYVFKKNPNSSKKEDAQLMDTLHISKQSAYLFGREKKVADILVEHPSLSKQHAVLQYRALPDKRDPQQKVKCKPYLMDLGSANGTFINGERLEEARYYELRTGDVITLGASTREYILLTDTATHL